MPYLSQLKNDSFRYNMRNSELSDCEKKMADSCSIYIYIILLRDLLDGSYMTEALEFLDVEKSLSSNTR